MQILQLGGAVCQAIECRTQRNGITKTHLKTAVIVIVNVIIIIIIISSSSSN